MSVVLLIFAAIYLNLLKLSLMKHELRKQANKTPG
jgi:hypothetical protein